MTKLLLSLDADTRCIGTALFSNYNLCTCGVLRAGNNLAFDRVQALKGQLLAMLHGLKRDGQWPDIAIEMPQHHAIRRPGGGYGAASLGIAVGTYIEAMSNATDGEATIHRVSIKDWCGNRNKAARARYTAAEFPVYDMDADLPDLHAGDAVGMGAWLIRQTAARALAGANDSRGRRRKKKKAK